MKAWRVRACPGLLAALAVAVPAAAAPVAHAPDRTCAGDDGPAAMRAGLAWRNGDGRPRDAAAALACLERAAALGLPQAMFILAQMAADGEGAAPDPVAARRWLERAAALDYPEALQAQAMAEPDPLRAAQLLREAAHALQHRARE